MISKSTNLGKPKVAPVRNAFISAISFPSYLSFHIAPKPKLQTPNPLLAQGINININNSTNFYSATHNSAVPN